MRSMVVVVILVFALSRGVQRVLTAVGLEILDGWGVTAFSLMFACVVWFVIAWWKKWLIFDKVLWWRSVPLSVVNIVIPGVAFTFAQVFVSAGVAALFVAFLPAVVAVLGWMFLRERLSLKVWLGVVVATVGVVVLTVGKGGSLSVSNWWLGVGLLLVGVVSAGVVYVGWRKLLNDYRVVELLAPQLFISTVIVVPLMFVFGEGSRVDVLTVFVLGGLGVVNYILPQLAMFWLLTKTTAVRSALANYLAPVFAIVLGFVFLNQPVTWLIVVGGVLIITGAVFVNMAKVRK